MTCKGEETSGLVWGVRWCQFQICFRSGGGGGWDLGQSENVISVEESH